MTATVTDLAEYRQQREWNRLREVIYTATEDELGDFWGDSLRFERERRGTEPTCVVVDEVHHWTNGWEHLLEEILRPTTSFRQAWLNSMVWAEPSPESRSRSEHALRILRDTDQRSDDGYAEGHRADPGVPRG